MTVPLGGLDAGGGISRPGLRGILGVLVLWGVPTTGEVPGEGT